MPFLAYVITTKDLLRTIQFLLDRYYSSWKKNAAFHWHSPQRESFLALKEKLTTAPILAYLNFSIPFTFYTNASGDSIGFNLTQVQHGKERAIAYGRRNFSDTEKKYSVTEWEPLSVIVAIQKCRPCLLGNHFTVVVDHQALKWLMSLCDPTGRLSRWPMTLQRYDFTIQYRPGKDHGNADALLRRVYSLCYHKLWQRSYATLKSVMTNSNLLSDTYRIRFTQGRPDSWENLAPRGPVFPQW